MNVVIDKSWLTNTKTNELIEFSKNHLLILIGPLGYELFTTQKIEQVKTLWKKLSFVKESVRLVETVGYFFNYEIENHNYVHDISNHFLDVNFNPHQDLINGNSTFSDDEINAMLYHKNYYEINRVDSYKEISARVYNYFPELDNIKTGYDRSKIQHIYDKAAYDKDFILFVYNDIKPENFPPTKLLNEKWTIYRWLQVTLLYGIDYVRKYGKDNLNIYSSKFANTNIDMDYVILGAIIGCLASNDDDIKYFYRLICPDKKLFC